MISPATYEEIKARREEARLRGLTLSNCYLLPEVQKEKAAAGLLSLKEIENGLLLLEDCGSFYRCYYDLSPDALPGFPDLHREAVAELPYNGSPGDKQLLQIRRLLEMGFSLGRESAVMSCSRDALISHRLPDLHVVHEALPSEISEILALLQNTFDPRFAYLPSREELCTALRDGRLLTVSKEGRLLAVLHAGLEGSAAMIRHLAVAEAYRGNGLGKCLVEAYHRKYVAQASVFRHWVDVKNAAAIALYRSFGYDFSIRKACEYVFTPKSSTVKERNAMKEQVLNILQDIRPDVDFENEKLLIDGGVLDSFDIISIVQEFNEAFGIDIDVEDLEPANFNTIEAMMELIEKLQNE